MGISRIVYNNSMIGLLPNDSEITLLREYNEEFRKTVLPVTIFFGVEIFFGVIGNLLVLYVFFFRYKSCNFRYFVLCLALIDFVSCLTTIPGEMVSQLNWFDYPRSATPVCKIKDFFNQFTICSEAACLTVIAVDRYRKVCQPFGWQIKKRTARYLCLVIYGIAAVLATPAPIVWGVHSEPITYKGQNITITVCEKDEQFRDTLVPLANIALNHSLITVSLICMSIMYVMITRQLIFRKRFGNRRSQQSVDDLVESSIDTPSTSTTSTPTSDVSGRVEPGTNAEDDSVTHSNLQRRMTSQRNELRHMLKIRRKTLIMLYLTIIFIVTTTLYGILIAIVADGFLPSVHGASKAVFFFFLRLYFINHVINPVLYGIMDPHFRKEMLILKIRFTMLFCRS